ncbi:hypothetical protein H0H87_010513 [Tephrocybe sp. NHM501043]|nr:hypothetical protein H0H87_010513 [Tephrocybe sp. NHM501043]
MAPRASSGARSEHTLSYADSVHPDAPMVASGIDGRQHTPGSPDTPGSIHEGAPKYRRNTASWRSESARASLASGRKRESAIEDDEDAVSKQAYKLPTGDPEHERHEAHLNSHRRTVTYSEPHKPDRRGNNVHSDAIHDDHVPPSVNSQSFPPETGQLPEFDAHSGLADTGGPMSLHHSYGRTSLSEQSRESPHMAARRFKQEREDRKRGTLKRQLRRLSKQSPKESRGADHSKTRLSGEVTPGDYLNVKNAGIRTRIKAFFRMG